MNKLYFTRTQDVRERLEGILFKLTGSPCEILRTENGKPYIEGNPLFFSVSHSKERAAIAVSDRPVGVDIEVFQDKKRLSVIARFTERERQEITCEREFLNHWTAREAFIKMRGDKLFENLKSMEYYGGIMYFCGEKQRCEFQTHLGGNFVVTVCLGEKL